MIDLRQGDSLEIMKGIPDKSIDLILCDLPYGTTACKWDIVIPFEELWEQYNRIIKDNGANRFNINICEVIGNIYENEDLVKGE